MKPTFLYHLLTLALLLCGMVMPSLQAQPYKNPSLSPEERTADLLQRMTLEEKIAQIRHIHSWNIFEEQELNKSKLQEFVGDLWLGICGGFSANWRKLSPTHAAYTRIYAKPYPTWNSYIYCCRSIAWFSA